jgi:hypothetical protein
MTMLVSTAAAALDMQYFFPSAVASTVRTSPGSAAGSASPATAR